MSDTERVHAEARKLFEQAEGDSHQLATLAAQYKLAAQARVGGTISVLGIVSSASGEPRVQIEWGENAAQLSVEAARAHALLMLEAAQNATSDASVVEWATDEMHLDRDQAAVMLDAVRRYRRDRWGQPDLDIEFQQPASEDGSPG